MVEVQIESGSEGGGSDPALDENGLRSSIQLRIEPRLEVGSIRYHVAIRIRA